MTEHSHKVVQCTFERHGAEVLEIFNHAIRTSTALYDYEPRTATKIADWFALKESLGLPVVGIESEGGDLEAFGSFGPFRNFPAYKYTVEHSVYVAEPCRGAGRGRMILEYLIAQARASNYHALIGAIDAENSASCGLHERMGFVRVGTLPQVGFKFGRWLDLALYQLTLETPFEPIDG